jgi:hypothetical protein
MNKLTAEKCREFISVFKSLEKEGHLALTSGYHLQALEIALPILEQQERGEQHGSDFIKCAWPCGWQELLRISMNDGAFLAKDLIEGGEVKDFHRHAALSNTDRLVRVISAIMKLQGQPPNQNGEQ